MMADEDLRTGDLVDKYRGEARWVGVIVADYPTLRGAKRYVVDVLPQRFQMIGTSAELRLIARGLSKEMAIKRGLKIALQLIVDELGGSNDQQ